MLWEFVGGKVEPGETPQEALIRECKEELAVTVCPGHVFMETVHEYPDLTVHLILYHAVIVDGTPQLLEHNDIRWIRTSEIGNYDFCRADVEILTKLQKAKDSLQTRLLRSSDGAYHDFCSKLIPTMCPEKILGVRMPALRKLAKELSGTAEAKSFLSPAISKRQITKGSGIASFSWRGECEVFRFIIFCKYNIIAREMQVFNRIFFCRA